MSQRNTKTKHAVFPALRRFFQHTRRYGGQRAPQSDPPAVFKQKTRLPWTNAIPIDFFDHFAFRYLEARLPTDRSTCNLIDQLICHPLSEAYTGRWLDIIQLIYLSEETNHEAPEEPSDCDCSRGRARLTWFRCCKCRRREKRCQSWQLGDASRRRL